MLVLGIILIVVGALVALLAPRTGLGTVGWAGPILIAIGLLLIVLQALGVAL